MRILRIFGMDVRMDPLLLVLGAVGMLVGAGLEMVSLMVFVLGHEICHSLVARRMGAQVEEVELMPFGGVIKTRDMDKMVGKREIGIALVGPAFNLACGIVLMYLVAAFPMYKDMLAPLVRVNITLGLFNLLPAFPLDGGRVLRSVLSFFISRERATKMATLLGMVLGIGLAGMGIWLGMDTGVWNVALIAMGAFLFVAAKGEERRWAFSSVVQYGDKRRMVKRGTVEERRILAGADMTLSEAASRFTRGAYYAIRVMDEDMGILGTVQEKDVMDAILSGQREKTLGWLLREAK
ncbi:M50 family metallopeptidase [Eubacteriales bacterium OttesenSCG-928-M02]|nr:M50 family metallopeptidase [Eubacteriales bacterium OttesenSCG-928-M02]